MSVLCIVVIAYCAAYCGVHIVHFPIQTIAIAIAIALHIMCMCASRSFSYSNHTLVAADFNSERHNDMDRAMAPK